VCKNKQKKAACQQEGCGEQCEACVGVVESFSHGTGTMVTTGDWTFHVRILENCDVGDV
jgi:hypothetical protein